MSLGQYYNGVKDFAAAENRYREALTFHRTIVGEGDPESMDPLMHIALELSNQERFDEADVLFKQVEASLPGASDQADRARYLSYQALHLANQRYFEDARKLAAEATKLRKNLLSKRTSRDDTATPIESDGSCRPAAGHRRYRSEPVYRSRDAPASRKRG